MTRTSATPNTRSRKDPRCGSSKPCEFCLLFTFFGLRVESLRFLVVVVGVGGVGGVVGVVVVVVVVVVVSVGVGVGVGVVFA